MSVEFSNAYQEILLENLITIIKQNFMFQTQLKLAEDTGKQRAELEAKYNDIVGQWNSVQGRLEEIESYKQRAENNTSAHQEKTRIQTALNDEMKKAGRLKVELEEKEGEISKLKDYISKLEEIAPMAKLKKINPEKASALTPAPIAVEEPAPMNLFKIEANDGSSF
jgi:predicted RNase H-like nuclease (RuvC/YqgF family)